MLTVGKNQPLQCDCEWNTIVIVPSISSGTTHIENGEYAGNRFDLVCCSCRDIVGSVNRSSLYIRKHVEPVAECSCDDPLYDAVLLDENEGQSCNMPLDPAMWAYCVSCGGKAPGLYAFNWDGEVMRLPRFEVSSS